MNQYLCLQPHVYPEEVPWQQKVFTWVKMCPHPSSKASENWSTSLGTCPPLRLGGPTFYNTSGVAIRQWPYRVLEACWQTIKEVVVCKLVDGITKQSISPWSSPIVDMTKPNGTLQHCNEFRRLNQVSKFDSYLMTYLMIIGPRMSPLCLNAGILASDPHSQCQTPNCL